MSITSESGRRLEQTAFSIVAREGKDYAIIITDADGSCIAQQSDCTPPFLGTLPATVRHFLARFPIQTLNPGDVVMTNDPWLGTGHLNDFSIALPVFDRRGFPLAFVACTTHMTDIGGSINFGAARENYEEGLRIPITKLQRHGQLNEELLEIIRANVRVSEQVIGDVMAMISAVRLGEARLVELAESLGEGGFELLSREILARTEAAMRSAIRRIPDGTYTAKVAGEGFVGPFGIEVALDVRDGTIGVDFSGSSAVTESSLNSPLAYTTAYTVYPLKCIVHPRIPNNDGTFRPIHVKAPAGSILNAEHPLAVDKRNLVGHMISPAILQALSSVLAEEVIAESGSTPGQFETFTGVDNVGRRFVQLVSHNGGMGASPWHDGEVACFPSNMGTTPVEIVEAQAPLLVLEKRILTDSAGAGKFRGGPGQRVVTRNVSKYPVAHNMIPCRLREPARGIRGGLPGTVFRCYLNGLEHPHPRGRWILEPGDEVTVEYPGGGGIGNPPDRERAAVIRDVQHGIVSLEAAERIYRLAQASVLDIHPPAGAAHEEPRAG